MWTEPSHPDRVRLKVRLCNLRLSGAGKMFQSDLLSYAIVGDHFVQYFQKMVGASQ